MLPLGAGKAIKVLFKTALQNKRLIQLKMTNYTFLAIAKIGLRFQQGLVRPSM